MEYWSDGILERWLSPPWISFLSLFHYSNIPWFQNHSSNPYSFQRDFTLVSTLSESLISVGLTFHSKGIVASRMMRDVMNLLSSAPRDGSRGVDLPLLIICVPRAGF